MLVLSHNNIKYLRENLFVNIVALENLQFKNTSIDLIDINAFNATNRHELVAFDDIQISNINFHQNFQGFIGLRKQVKVEFKSLRYSWKELLYENKRRLYGYFPTRYLRSVYFKSFFFRLTDSDDTLLCLSSIYFTRNKIRFNLDDEKDILKFLDSCSHVDIRDDVLLSKMFSQFQAIL